MLGPLARDLHQLPPGEMDRQLNLHPFRLHNLTVSAPPDGTRIGSCFICASVLMVKVATPLSEVYTLWFWQRTRTREAGDPSGFEKKTWGGAWDEIKDRPGGGLV